MLRSDIGAIDSGRSYSRHDYAVTALYCRISVSLLIVHILSRMLHLSPLPETKCPDYSENTIVGLFAGDLSKRDALTSSWNRKAGPANYMTVRPTHDNKHSFLPMP